MNRFLIESTPQTIPKSLCDQHVVKMPLEEAQMLCTALWYHAPKFAEERGLYKPVHQKHPCTLWVMESRANYNFAYTLYLHMCFEYWSRFHRRHGVIKHFQSLGDGKEFIPKGKITRHPQCFSGLDELKTDEFYPLKAYRQFYIVDKARFARYNNGRDKPSWFNPN